MNAKRLSGLLAALLILLLPRPLWASEEEDAVSMQVLTASVQPGMDVKVSLDYLVPGRAYGLRLVGTGVDQEVLGSFEPASPRFNTGFVVPQVANGSYQVQLRRKLDGTMDATAPLKLAAPPSLLVRSPRIQAGSPLLVRITGAEPGTQVELNYAGRRVWGPQPAEAVMDARFVIPADIPAVLPADVALNMQARRWRERVQNVTITIPVQAPFTGRFAELQSVELAAIEEDGEGGEPRLRRSSAGPLQVRPGQGLVMSGQMALFDEVRPEDLDVRFLLRTHLGENIPLNASGFDMQADGRFQVTLVTPHKAGGMNLAPGSAVDPPLSFSSVFVEVARRNAVRKALSETERFDAGALKRTVAEVLAPTLLQVRARTTFGTQLENALVVVTGPAPFSGDSMAAFFGPSLRDALNERMGGGTPSYQVAPYSSIANLPSSEPANQFGQDPLAPLCGATLSRLFTDFLGQANVDIVQPIQAQPGPLAQIATELRPDFWSCRDVDVPGLSGPRQACTSMTGMRSRFWISVYTYHLGAAHRQCTGFGGNTCTEMPTVFMVEYNQASGRLYALNVLTGVEQEVNVNETPLLTLDVVVPPFTALGQNQFATDITELAMWQTSPTQPSPRPVPSQTSALGSVTTFGKWVNFSLAQTPTAFDHDLSDPVRRFIKFEHTPGVVSGSLTEAELWIRQSNGRLTKFGDFAPASSPASCDQVLQGTSQTWVAEINALAYRAWRYPYEGFLYPGGPKKACGEIRFSNSGFSGAREVCFEWQDPPPSLSLFPLQFADDSDMNAVRVQAERQLADNSDRSNTRGSLDGEPIRAPAAQDNSASRTQVLNALIGADGPREQQLVMISDNGRQMNRSAGTRTETVDANRGGTVSIPVGPNTETTLLDFKMDLFRWFWGVPGLASADIYAQLRILIKFFAGGMLKLTPDAQVLLDYETRLRMLIGIVIGIEIGGFFGVIHDAQAALAGSVTTVWPLVIRNNAIDSQTSRPCFVFSLDFNASFDPAPLTPVPRIHVNGNIVEHRTRPDCVGLSPFGYLETVPTVLAEIDGLKGRSKAEPPPLDFQDFRLLRRQPAVAYDEVGNAQVLALDEQNWLVARRMQGDEVASTHVLSKAPSIHGAQIAYFDNDRAVAVWAESSLGAEDILNGTYKELVGGQVLYTAVWAGPTRGWSGKQRLGTQAGAGNVSLAACPAGRPGCPSRGEVLAAWQADDAVYYSQFGQFGISTGWTDPKPLDPSVTATVGLSPSATYVGAQPVAVWVRRDLGSSIPEEVANRRLAYRFLVLGGQAREATGLPVGVAAPSAAESADGGLRIAFTVADPDTGFISNRHALHVARGSCAAGECTFTWTRLRDAFDRAIFVERPRLLRAPGEDEPQILARIMQFGDVDGESLVDASDPIGAIVGSGDLVSISSRFDASRARVLALTNDGAMHFAPVAAIDRLRGSLVALSAVYAPPAMDEAKSLLSGAGKGLAPAYAKSKSLGGLLEMHSMPALPDLVVEQVTASDSRPGGGQSIQIAVRVGNRGTGFLPARDGAARLDLRWDAPEGTEAPAASLALGALPAGAETVLSLNLDTPADMLAGQPRALFASLVVAEDFEELDGENNRLRFDFDGLPSPTPVLSQLIVGVPFVQLNWPDPEDPLVAGWRIYADDGDGQWQPLGSTPVNGFLDLSAQFDQERSYRVASFSADGAESAPSAVVTVAPRPLVPLSIFANDFEPTPGLEPVPEAAAR